MLPTLRQKVWEWRGVWIIAPTIAGIAIALRLAGWLQPLEWAALDQYFRWRPKETIDSHLLIVGINEVDLKQVKQWPIPDAVLAQLLLKLKTQRPQAIGLDLYRDFPVEPGHKALVKVFETTPNLIGIEKVIEDENSSGVAPPPALHSKGQVSPNDVIPDADGKLRRSLLYLTDQEGNVTPSFGMKLALMYLEAQGITPQPAKNNPRELQLNQTVLHQFKSNDGGYINADAGGYQILLNYRGAAKSFRTVSMSDVLENRVPAEWIRDRIVLIGATATSLNDFFYTPYSNSLTTIPEQTSGVEIQANLTSQILSSALERRAAIQTWSEPAEIVWIILWSFMGATLCWFYRDADGIAKLLPRWTLITLLLASTGLVGGTYLAFLQGLWIPVVPSALVFIGSAIAVTSYIANLEREDRQTVMNLFGRHVSPKIAEAIWRDRQHFIKEGRLPGLQTTATVLFTDLKGFSTITEIVDPETLLAWLNEYMDAMAQLVLEHGGVVDKFIGDAVMAVFGVPIPSTTPEAIAQDAIAAVSCAVAMATRLEALNQQWQRQGRPTTAMRVGIATGQVIAGSLGSSQRLDYTTLGDSVNVAARLESYDKAVGEGLCRILINDKTYQYIETKFSTQVIGQVVLKGREQPTEVYQVLLPKKSSERL
jgi:adenylate cyclase